MGLKQGNFIKLSDIEVRVNHLILAQLDQTSTERKYEPIELSELWLEKFGFFFLASTKNTVAYILNGVKVVLTDGSARVYDRSELVTHIKYVHELQNLYQEIKGHGLIYQNLIAVN